MVWLFAIWINTSSYQFLRKPRTFRENVWHMNGIYFRIVKLIVWFIKNIGFWSNCNFNYFLFHFSSLKNFAVDIHNFFSFGFQWGRGRGKKLLMLATTVVVVVRWWGLMGKVTVGNTMVLEGEEAANDHYFTFFLTIEKVKNNVTYSIWSWISHQRDWEIYWVREV